MKRLVFAIAVLLSVISFYAFNSSNEIPVEPVEYLPCNCPTGYNKQTTPTVDWHTVEVINPCVVKQKATFLCKKKYEFDILIDCYRIGAYEPATPDCD